MPERWVNATVLNVTTKADSTAYRGANLVNTSQCNWIGATCNGCAARPRSEVGHSCSKTPVSKNTPTAVDQPPSTVQGAISTAAPSIDHAMESGNRCRRLHPQSTEPSEWH